MNTIRHLSARYIIIFWYDRSLDTDIAPPLPPAVDRLPRRPSVGVEYSTLRNLYAVLRRLHSAGALLSLLLGTGGGE